LFGLYKFGLNLDLVLCDTSILIVDTYVTIPVWLPRSRYTAVYRSITKYRITQHYIDLKVLSSASSVWPRVTSLTTAQCDSMKGRSS